MYALCKRKYKTLTLLALVAGLFYMLQCLSVFRLGELSDARAHAWGQSNHKAYEDDQHLLFKGRNRIVDGEVRMYKGLEEIDLIKNRVVQNTENLYVPLKLSDGNNLINEARVRKYDDTIIEMKVDAEAAKQKDSAFQDGKLPKTGAITTNMRGVNSKDRHLYLGEDGLFACLSDMKTRISLEQVNDDFCDCLDGSDEPGTSACPYGSFHCSLQVPGLPPQMVSSSKVNDGICDCCDGSDEWNGVLLPDSIRIKEGEKLGSVYHAPCSDKCKLIMEIQRKKQMIRERGQKLQRDYIRQAVHELPQPAQRKKYGPDGVFYPLSKQCFSLKDKAYTYEVCPFSKIEQKTQAGSPTNLGRNAKPIVMDQGQQLLRMVDGDTKLCPFGRARRSKIYLLCDVEEILLKVTESEVCEYTFTLTTPAAC